MASDRAARPRAPPFVYLPGYARHKPEATLLYQLVERYYPEPVAVREAAGRPLPKHVHEEFEAYLKCGRLEHGFLRVRCEDCHAEKRVAFSCKRRGFCPSCGARRMTDSAALLADEVLPAKPIRQWRLKRVFGIEIEQCAGCGGLLKVLASIEEPELIERILAHLRERGEDAVAMASLGARAAA
jgi:ribosomal protein S27E